MASSEGGGMATLLSKGASAAESANTILGDLANITGDLRSSKALSNSLQSLGRASSNMEAILAAIRPEDISQILHHAKSSSARLDNILARIEEGPGSLHSLIYDPGAVDDLRILLGGAQRSHILRYFLRESVRNAQE